MRKLLLICALCFGIAAPFIAREAASWSARPRLAAVGNDLDQDGLSDADELNLYGTNPQAADTDQDGQKDGEEIIVGTDPTLASSVFRILSGPARQPDGKWRITWSSVPGRTYHLQALHPNALNSSNSAWTDVSVVLASGPVTYADDSPSSGLRIFRVVHQDVVAINYSVSDVTKFSILDGAGDPQNGTVLQAGSDGILPPFEFRPEGASQGGLQQGLSIRFPQGARLVQIGGRQYISYTNAEVSFGPASSIQLVNSVSSRSPASLRSGMALIPRQLPVGPISVSDLANLLGLPPEQGIEVELFGKVKLVLYAGIIEDSGIGGARVGVKVGGLPLPGQSGEYTDYHLDLQNKDGIKLPFYGEFSLPDGSSNPPKLKVAKSNPIWLEIKPDGHISLIGRADLEFEGGKPTFSVDFGFDDPSYHLGLAAKGLTLPFADSLVDLLPHPATQCVDATPTLESVRRGRLCLQSFQRAYFNFNATAVGTVPAIQEISSPSAPPTTEATAASILEAWAHSAFAQTLNTPAGLVLKPLLRRSADSATGARDLPSLLQHRLALARARAAFQNNQLNGGSVSQTDFDEAMAQASAAATRRSQEPQAVSTLQNMEATFKVLLETEEVMQQAGGNESTVRAAMHELLKRFADQLVNSLGVQEAVFVPPTNSVIYGMNRFNVFETCSSLVRLMELAQRLQIDHDMPSGLQETMGQLAYRLDKVVDVALAEAEANNDYPAFLYALEDMMDLIVLRQQSVFPSNPTLDVVLPDAGDLPLFGQKMGSIFQADMLKPEGQRSIGNRLTELKRLNRVLGQMPASVTFGAPPFQRAYDRMETALAFEFNTLTTHRSLPRLLLLLEAGILHDQLRQQFNLTEVVSWEGIRLTNLMSRLKTQILEQKGWTEADRAVSLLLARAQKFGPTETTRAKLYLDKAAELLDTTYTLAQQIWSAAENYHLTDPKLRLADALLPGDIQVENAAGSLRYNGKSQQLEGAISGELRLPKFDFVLNLVNASFTSGGNFDMQAYGQLGIPGTGGGPALGRIVIPAGRPIHLGYQYPDNVKFSGGARVELNNGMYFESYMVLEDPEYAFGIEFGGLRFDLADKLRGYVPVLPSATVFRNAAASDLNDYFRSMSATLHPLTSLADAPPVRDVGEPPDFTSPATVLPTDGLEAMANSELADAHLGLSRNYADTLASVQSQFKALQNRFDQESQSMELARMIIKNDFFRRYCQALEIKRTKSGADPTRDLGPAILGLVSEAETTIVRLLQRPGPFSLQTENDLFFLAYELIRGATNGCISGTNQIYTPDALKAELKNFNDRTLISRITQLGLDPASGHVPANPVLLHSLSPELLKSGLTNLVVRRDIQFWNDQFRIAANNADALEYFERAKGEVMLELRRQAVEASRINKVDKEENYPEIRRWHLELWYVELQLNLGIFNYPADARFIHLDGSTTGYSAERETEDRDTKFHGAFLYASEHPRRIFVPKERVKLSPEGAADQPTLLVNTRIPNLEAIMGLDHSLAEFLWRAKYIQPASYLIFQRPERQLSIETTYKQYLQSISLLPDIVGAPPSVQDAQRMLITNRLNHLRAQIQKPLSSDPAEGLRLLKEIISLSTLAEQKQLIDELAQIRVDVRELTEKYRVLAEAQKAWWYLHEYTALLHDAAYSKLVNDASVLRGVFEESFNITLRSAATILNDLKLLLPTQRPVDLKLPGDLMVERVFGDIYYNKTSNYLRGTFGGRVSFPDLDGAFFEISRATIANDGKFSIDAATAGPLPFDGVSVEATVHAEGTARLAGGFSGDLLFQGAGKLHLPGGRPPVDVEVNYTQLVENNRIVSNQLQFDTTAPNLSWRLTEDVVLFGGHFGFTVSTTVPTGELRAGGSAGFFRKNSAAPAPDPLNRNQFHLFVENLEGKFNYDLTGRYGLEISGGRLYLPDIFYPTNLNLCQTPAGASPGASVAITPNRKLTLEYVAGGAGESPRVNFAGSLDFHHLGFAVPGIEGMGAALCSATLTFSDHQLPVLSGIEGTLLIPLPQQTNHIDLHDGVISLTGFPSGRIELREDLSLHGIGGLTFTLLGVQSDDCDPSRGTSLQVYPGNPGFNQFPSFKLDGGIKVKLPLSAMTTTNLPKDEVTGVACGSLYYTNGSLPRLELSDVVIGGTFRMGDGGPMIKDAELRFSGLDNIFSLSEANPFVITVGGTLKIPQGPAFSLDGAKFTFFDPNRLPRFQVTGMGIDNRDFSLMQKLPVRLDAASFQFHNPAAELPNLFYPSNINFKVSASVSIPPPPSEPYFGGEVNNLEIEFLPDGTPLMKSIGSFGLALKPGFKIPPIEEFGGQLLVGGLNGDGPADIFIVGRLAGSYNGYKLKFQGAFNMFGPIGLCLDVNAGAVGIPLGPSGFLISGASGGISFVNSNGDPCDFKTYYTTDAEGNLVAPSGAQPIPTMSWADLLDFKRRIEQQAVLFAEMIPGAPLQARQSINGPTLQAQETEIPCPGDCPPPTVNIFCQPHPDAVRFPNKIIIKFTSIDEETLNDIFQITPENIASLGANASQVAVAVANRVTNFVAQLTPLPTSPMLADRAAALTAMIEEGFQMVHGAVLGVLTNVLNDGMTHQAIYEAIRDTVYTGLPCPDVTYKVSGTLTHVAVSSFLSGTVEGILSTTGSAGVVGKVNLLGMPVGTLKAFVAITDSNGLPNPSICGRLNVAFGPLEVGEVKMTLECPGCVTGVIGAVGEAAVALSVDLFNHIAGKVDAGLLSQGLSRVEYVSRLNQQQQIAFLGEILQTAPELLPPNLPHIVTNALGNVWDSINPRFLFCGEVKPKLFGMPLVPTALGVNYFADKDEYAGSVKFSPSLILGFLLDPRFFPPVDSATISFALRYPDPLKYLLVSCNTIYFAY